ncbi:MAG: polysaccharide biosynthesis protein [Chitinophagaceae bacterium]|nr:MAG: polysaccharide biosynthesis protein [Chitinophagaceae bacterium]
MKLSIFKYLKSSLIRGSLVYSGFNVLNSTLPFLLIPFLTRMLNTDDYGRISMITIFVTFVSPIVGLSTNSIVSKNYFQVDFDYFKQTVQSVFIILFVSILSIAGISYFLKEQLFYFTGVNSTDLLICLLLSGTQFVITLVNSIFQMESKPFHFGVLQLSQTLINTSLTIYFIYFLNYGWHGRIYGWIIANFLIAILGLFILFNKSYFKEFKFRTIIVKEVLAYSLPIIPYTLSGMLVSLSDRFLVNKFLGSSYVGIFTLGLQISGVLNIVFTSLNSAFVPWVYKKISKNESLNYLLGSFYIFSLIMVLISFVFLGSIYVFLDFFVGIKFAQIGGVVHIFILSNLFNSIYLIFTNYFIYKGDTKILAYNTLIVTILNIPICYLFINYFHFEGAIWSSMITSVFSLVLVLISAHKLYKFPWFHPITKF